MVIDTSNEVYKYKWVVLVCTSAVNFLVWGSLYSVGIYYVQWIEYFQETKAKVAITGGLSSGTTSVLGPLFSILVNRFGFRKMGAVGGILMSIGTFASAFSPSLVWLGFSYGMVAGTGAGLSYLSAAVAVNEYFVTRRSLAEGVMSMGTGLGTFAVNVFSQYLINLYDWSGALTLTGAVLAHLVILFQLTIPASYLERFPKLREWKSQIQERSRQKTENVQINDDNDDDQDKIFQEPVNDEDSTEIVKYVGTNSGMDHHSDERESWLRQCLVLFRNPVFLLLLLSDFLCWLCIYVPFVHLAERSRLSGVDSDTTAWISSTIGLSGIVGRPLVSAIPDMFRINVFYVFGSANIILGIATVISPFFSTKIGLFVYAGVFGFLSVSVPLSKASAADLLGVRVFPTVFGWMMLFEGLGIYIGSPLAGWIYDVTHSYDNSFYCMGGGLILSGSMVALRNAAIRLQLRMESGKRGRNSFPHTGLNRYRKMRSGIKDSVSSNSFQDEKETKARGSGGTSLFDCKIEMKKYEFKLKHLNRKTN